MKKFSLIGFLILILFGLFVLASCDDNANSTNDYCTVIFNTDGGSNIQNQKVLKGEKIAKPDNPNKEGYTFDDWYYKGEKWSFVGYIVTEDMTLVAKWNINRYLLNLSINDTKAGTISNISGYYNYNEPITIEAQTNPGYTFDGWYDGENQITDKISYTFNMPVKNLSYTARWIANKNTTYRVEHYLQNIDNNYPSTPFETDSLTGTTDALTKGEVNAYEGFTSPIINQVKINGNGNTVIKLYYERNDFIVSLEKNIEEAGRITGSGTYKYGETINIKAETNEGYTFGGWYKDNKLYSDDESFNYKVSSSNVSFEARYIVNKYKVIIDNQAEGVNITGITSGNSYDYGSYITLKATNIPDGYAIKWSRSDEDYGKVASNSYRFSVPSSNIIVTATLSKLYVREDNKIYFGTYPQTLVEATNTNELSLIQFDSSTWTSYKYYAEGETLDYMFYKDVDIDSDGTFDYRGVYFTQYRPNYHKDSSLENNSFQDDNGYSSNNIYWFSYDPIEWNILTGGNDKALIIANLLLDCQNFYPITTDPFVEFEHNGGLGTADRYDLSEIRKWLNSYFYNISFNNLQKELIKTTEVNISNGSYNTNDKIFLLSIGEVGIYYTAELNSLVIEVRQASATDYAKCQGLRVSIDELSLGYSTWMLRTPYGIGTDTIDAVEDFGQIQWISHLANENLGIRPACWITL